MDKKIDNKNLRFTYADNVLPSKERESNMISNLNMWFDLYIEEINNQDGRIWIYFKPENIGQNLNLDEFVEPLKGRLVEYWQSFQHPNNF